MFKKVYEETLPEKWNADLMSPQGFASLCLEEQPCVASANNIVCLRVRSADSVADFLALYRRDATPQQIALALGHVIPLAQNEKLLPLLLVPYLKEEQLLALEKQGVSALDLCGNGVVTAPGQFHVFRTGFPNRFTSSRPLKNVYRGLGSLVARAFLLQPEYAEIADLRQEIIRCGADVSLPTLSKALTELEADMVVERVRTPHKPQARALRLLQPDKLLGRLTQRYAPPRVQRTFVGKAALDTPALRAALQANAQRSGARLIATGIGSAGRYASLAMEDTVYVYTDALDALLQDLPATPTTRFPNLHIRQTDDATVYFDPRPDDSGFPWASPLSAYLEMTHSEERLQQSATQIRARLLPASPVASKDDQKESEEEPS